MDRQGNSYHLKQLHIHAFIRTSRDMQNMN
jgi:hypothetical protein